MEFRALPTYRKDDYALRADVVREALEQDTEKGLIPFMLSKLYTWVDFPCQGTDLGTPYPFSRNRGYDQHRYNRSYRGHRRSS
jgi:hypothetical protein